MKKCSLPFLVCFFFAVACAESETFSGKEIKDVALSPCPEWYRDTEWNVALWGAYGFGSDDNHSHTIFIPSGESHTLQDLTGDNGAWGGGIDLKYFFHHYFGVGIEGFLLQADRGVTIEELQVGFTPNDDPFGAVKGTVTLRYPIPCSRFAPYIYAGGGVLFSKRERVSVLLAGMPNLGHRADDNDPRACGQAGGGLEVRVTRHIAWIADFSWNFTKDDSFGMMRSGLNFAF
jgi:hypothetical protein